MSTIRDYFVVTATENIEPAKKNAATKEKRNKRGSKQRETQTLNGSPTINRRKKPNQKFMILESQTMKNFLSRKMPEPLDVCISSRSKEGNSKIEFGSCQNCDKSKNKAKQDCKTSERVVEINEPCVNTKEEKHQAIEEISKAGLISDTEVERSLRIPSLKKVLQEKKELEQEKRCLESLTLLNSSDPQSCSAEADDSTSASKFNKIIDCYNLSANEIRTYFFKYKDYLRDVMEGKMDSDRHVRYQVFKPEHIGTRLDLTYSTSLVIFKYEQKEELLQLMYEEFDVEKNKTEYFFKVLLPEICLKIFMDVHNMNQDTAAEYLDWRPIALQQ